MPARYPTPTEGLERAARLALAACRSPAVPAAALPDPVTAALRRLDGALAGRGTILGGARALSMATTGKGPREAFPQAVRIALAGLDGAISRVENPLP